MDYHGITHLVPHWALGVWRRFLCRRNMHAFDECTSAGEDYLSCDACGLMVHIDRVDTTYTDPQVLANNDLLTADDDLGR